MATAHVVSKCPNVYGVQTLSLDVTGMKRKSLLPIIGDLVVQLGIAMGAIDAAEVANLPYNSPVPIKADALEWCDPPIV